MDIQAMQSMDWLFKKERIYLLAQFWQQRATLAEKEVSALKERLATANQNLQGKAADVEPAAMEAELAAKDKEIAQLVEDVQRLQGSLAKLQEASAAQVARLEEQRLHIARLEARLDQQRDYEDLKREISLLRNMDIPASGEKPLELLLMERNKAMQNEQKLSEQSGAPASGVSSSVPVSTPSSTPAPVQPPVTHEPPVAPSIPPPPPPPPPPLFPPPLQNVETFGSFLGEEIVANWRRSLERTILSQGMSSSHLSAHSPPTDGAPTPQPPPPETPTSDKPPTASPNPASPCPVDRRSPPLLNGNPKTPPEDQTNNNHHHQPPTLLPPPSSTPGPMPAPIGFFRSEDMKSPFRFDDPRSPFRFTEEPTGVMVGRLGESLIPKGDPMEARLQEMLRYNMDKYASQNLDTLHISRKVRELLSINNIGQRLFAKYVLGLSQGTVSELLSKPKPWDKLTEKGRDSYRKMHAWACDDNAVLLLKSLIPKKGVAAKDTGLPPFGRPDPDNMTEERIAHILSEASQMMKTEVEDSHSYDSKSPNQQCLSPFDKDSQNRRLKKYENDDIPQEKVVRIYQEELAKLMGRRMDDMRGPREQFPSLLFPHFFGAGGGPLDRTQEEIRLALDAYHRELAKLSCPSAGLLALQQQQQQQQQQQAAALSQQQHQLNGVVQDLSLPKDRKDISKLVNGEVDQDKKDMMDMADVLRHAGSAFSLVRPKLEPGIGQPNQPSTGSSTAGSPLSNSILPPAMNPADDFVNSSPLQRMASITNSLISQPSTPTHHSPSQRPLKAVLPPITQQQFDMYNNLNTEEIVKKVKEALSQYSISQRLFGESVLGLSQGSVSDLLARPKPWHMLTQKGREPFIRMKMFLEDENAVHKLVASQYKIAPEKLMRTGSYAGGPPCASLPKPQPPTPKLGPPENKGMPGDNPGSILPPSLQLVPPHSQAPTSVPQPPPPPMMVTPPSHMADLKKGGPPHHNLTPHHVQANALRSMQMTPSVYEMAALTQDLDTQTITTKIKEALLANNIGQKIFGEAVLGLSQGSVSELLSKPKPWHMLSIKGREPFIRMQLWLSDAHNIDRLQALKNERREANKRRRSSGPGHHGGGGADNSSDTSSNDTSEFYHSPSPGPGPPSAKKQRVLFSEEQKEALRLAFALDSYPSVATIEFLGAELALSSRTITNWFHNHRMRLKQQMPHGMSDGNGMQQVNRDASTGGQSFDPVQFRLLLNQRLLELQNERMGLSSVSLPYPPYFTPNSSLTNLIQRGLLPPGDCDLSGAIGGVNASKEQFSGLDLSMGVKRELDFEDEEDADSNIGSENSNLSSSSLRETSVKKESTAVMAPARSNRRKPAAPQWVNPEWQEASGTTEENKDKSGDKEVIINGVCVMQTDDYGMKLKDEETVRVEPTPVMDRYDEDDDDDQCSEASSDAEHRNSENVGSEGLLPRRTSEGEAEDQNMMVKPEPSSPHNVIEPIEGVAEIRHMSIKQESILEEGNEATKDWEQENCQSENADVLDPLPNQIKTEVQEERWQY